MSQFSKYLWGTWIIIRKTYPESFNLIEETSQILSTAKAEKTTFSKENHHI